MVRTYNLLVDKQKRVFYAEINLLVLLSLFIMAFVNLNFPVLRLVDEFSNRLFMLCVLFIPVLLFINGFFLKGVVFKLLNLVVFIVPSVAVLLFASAIVIDSIANVQHLQTAGHMKTTDYDLKVYQSDGSALSREGIIFRQEKELLPGLIIVRDIYRSNDKRTIKYKLDNNFLIIDGDKYELKRNLYFK